MAAPMRFKRFYNIDVTAVVALTAHHVIVYFSLLRKKQIIGFGHFDFALMTKSNVSLQSNKPE